MEWKPRHATNAGGSIKLTVVPGFMDTFDEFEDNERQFAQWL